MAVLAFSAAGAVIGSGFAGFLGLSGASIGWTIGGILGNMLFPQRLPDQHTEGPRIADTRFVSSAYGQMVPIVYGTYPVAGNIIWMSAVREVANTTTQQVGGKGGSTQTVSQTNYSYFVDLAVLLCEGEIAGVRKIKVNGETKYAVGTAETTETIAGSALLAAAIRVYPGSETQTADPLIEAAEGTNAPGYRGYAYVVIESMDVTGYGGRPPAQMEFEVVTVGTEADLDVVTVNTLETANGAVPKLLGRNGDVYGGPESVGGEADRWNFYAGAKVGVFVPASYEYTPCGFTVDGECIASRGSAAQILFVLHEDGSATGYTGGFALLGTGSITGHHPAVVAESAAVWWCQGDSIGSTRFFRADISGTTLTATLISGAFCHALARNACSIAGRVYMHGSATSGGQKYVAYVDSASSSLVLLVSQSTLGGITISSDGYIWYGPADSVAERKTLRKYSQDGTLLLTVDVNNTEALTTGWTPFEDRAGFIWAIGIESGSNERAYQIHPTTGQILQQSELFVGTMLGFTEDNRAVISDTVTGNYVFKEIEKLPRLTLGTTALSSVVQDIATRDNVLVSGDMTLTALTDTVRGYAIARRMLRRSAIEPLMPAYNWDLIESDDVLKAVKRSGTVAATIDELDLGAHEYGGTVPSALISKRLLETELPLEVAVQYPDVDADYEPGVQYARRLSGASNDPAVIQMPMVLSATEAQRLAEVVLYDRWTARMVHEISVPRRYSRIEPSDVISVTSDGATHTLFVVGKRESDGLIALDCVADNASVYSPAGVGASLPTPTGGVGVDGPTVLRLLDIPLLRDQDDGAGFYAVGCGYYSGWPGAELWRSIDGGVSYTRTDTSFLTAAPIGAALTALSNFLGGNVWDESSTVQVYVMSGTLSSSTRALVEAGTNAAYLGGELIGYREATLISTGKYTLSGLLRGRKGTEQYMSTHAIGELFVALDTDSARRVPVESSEIGVERLYKAPTFGQVLTEAAVQSFTLSSVGQECVAPVKLGIGRTAAASYDIIINWVRRARLNAEWRDYVDVPVGETSEAYVVEIYTDGTYATLKRTISGISTTTTTYTSAQQVTDFGSNQATIYVKVYQVSATVGNGFALTGSG